ncbi:MAG: hypothetical protein AAF581_08850 [Planctomycetota bacterium]
MLLKVRRRQNLLAALVAFCLVTCACDRAGGPPAPPEALVQALGNAAEWCQLEPLWQVLPSQYQRDVEELRQLFAAQLDEELWAQGVTLASTFRAAAARQLPVIQRWLAASIPVTDDGPKSIDETLAAVERLVTEGELSSLARFKTTRMATLLEVAGMIIGVAVLDRMKEHAPDVVERLKAFANCETTVLHANNDRVLMRVVYKESPPEELSFVKIDDAWMLKEFADQWPRFMEVSRQTIAQIDLAAGKRLLSLLNKVVADMSTLEDPARIEAALERGLESDRMPPTIREAIRKQRSEKREHQKADAAAGSRS